MREVDNLRMKRRQLDVEIKRIEDKLHDKREELKDYDKRITVLVSKNSNDDKSFVTVQNK